MIIRFCAMVFFFAYLIYSLQFRNLPNGFEPYYGGFNVGKTYIGISNSKPFHPIDTVEFTVLARKEGWIQVRYSSGNISSFHTHSLMTSSRNWSQK